MVKTAYRYIIKWYFPKQIITSVITNEDLKRNNEELRSSYINNGKEIKKEINYIDPIIYRKFTVLHYAFTLKILDLCSIHIWLEKEWNSILRISKINRKLIQN